MIRLEKVAAVALEKAHSNRYLLAAAVSKRANELAEGAQPLIKTDAKTRKFADIAIIEIAEGLITIEGMKEA